MAYLFDPDQLHQISRDAVAHGGSQQTRFDYVAQALERLVPGRTDPRPRWVLNSANGALGQLALLYASLTEYVIFFGSPIGTEGHSGRYLAEVYDFMLTGEMWTYLEGETEKTVYKPGDAAFLPRRRAKGYCIHEGSWMLEYARGLIPAMLPSGLADNFSSNLDMRSLGYTVVDYGRLTIRELLRGKI